MSLFKEANNVIRLRKSSNEQDGNVNHGPVLGRLVHVHTGHVEINLLFLGIVCIVNNHLDIALHAHDILLNGRNDHFGKLFSFRQGPVLLVGGGGTGRRLRVFRLLLHVQRDIQGRSLWIDTGGRHALKTNLHQSVRAPSIKVNGPIVLIQFQAEASSPNLSVLVRKEPFTSALPFRPTTQAIHLLENHYAQILHLSPSALHGFQLHHVPLVVLEIGTSTVGRRVGGQRWEGGVVQNTPIRDNDQICEKTNAHTRTGGVVSRLRMHTYIYRYIYTCNSIMLARMQCSTLQCIYLEHDT